MKKTLLLVALSAISVLLVYLLYKSIELPIDFKQERENRETAVKERLLDLAHLQKMHKDLGKGYAGHWDSLKNTLIMDTFFIEKVIGDPNDTTVVVVRKMVPFPAKDSLTSFVKSKGYESIDDFFAKGTLVPNTDPSKPAVKFEIESDSAFVEGAADYKDATFEIRTKINSYMWDYPAEEYNIYDADYDPSMWRKVGDLSKITTSGNWAK